MVSTLAAPLPAMMIGKLLGFPDDAWPQLVDWSERTIAGGGGPRYLTDDTILAAMDFAQAAADLYDAKQGCPADDVMSVWTGATGKPPLERDTVISDSLLLLDGGAETTRTVIARGLLLFIEHPGEWEKLRAGADLTVATEELIRYITPIHNMCRVALEDAPVAGGVVPAGHQVVMLYGAANRDPAHFEDPDRFDVTRGHNNHIAFGFGTHFCLGAALARLEIAVFFEELARRVRSLQLTPGTAPVDMPNAFVNGLRSRPPRPRVRLTQARTRGHFGPVRDRSRRGLRGSANPRLLRSRTGPFPPRVRVLRVSRQFIEAKARFSTVANETQAA